MDVSTSGRFHLGELGLAATARIPVVFLFGVNPFELLIYETALLTCSMFHHSTIRLPSFLQWLRFVVVTPEWHSLHHSKDTEHFDTNFASVLPIWDRIFRTALEPQSGVEITHGLDRFDDENTQTVRGMLMTPFQHDPASQKEH